MQNIKNIIFDFGGVFIAIDFTKTKQAFVDLGITNFDAFYTQHTASNLFEDLETGKLTPEEFYDLFRKQTKTELTDEQIKTAWNALLGGYYEDRLEWLGTVNKQYNVYLLSNTNLIHHRAFMEIYQQQTGKTNFNDFFIKAYYSHEMGLRKPNLEAYHHVLQNHQLQANETLFIDDTISNIEGAKLAGLHTFHLLPHLRLQDIGL